MIGNEQWRRYIYTLDLENKSKRVKQIDYSLVAEDMLGTLHMTDLQLQEGSQISAHIPATQDILSPVEFNIDEWVFLNTVSNPVKRGTQPVYHEKVKNRFYNIVGRGHEVISIPNVFHEDYTFPLVTTGLDIELRAKEDFDLLRIRTNDGAHVPDRKYSGIPSLEHHPLNYKYTREFYFDGGKAGEKIELKATIRAARVNGKDTPLKQHEIIINGSPMKIERQRFMLAPEGSFRIGIEFYKQVEEEMTNDSGEKEVRRYLKDIGIGYYGIAELNQWTYGVSRL
ncbi:hypothetical protein [Geobacillus phage GR1]|nr:hypothetical protein [Geobacillus phage GR1]